MIDLTFRRKLTKQLIARDPSAITIYTERPTADGSEGTLTFTGRVATLSYKMRDQAGPAAEHTVGQADRVLYTEYDVGSIENGDIVKQVSQGNITYWYRVVKSESFDYKKEVFLVHRE